MAQAGLAYLRKFEITDPHLVLRRYLPAKNFRSLVESRTLHFSPAAWFKADPWEGLYWFRDYIEWDRQLRNDGWSWAARWIAWKAKGGVARNNRQAVLISCWTANNTQTRRVWRNYTGGRDGVAIETTIGALRRELGPDFLIIRVTYGGPGTVTIPKDHSLFPYFFKRKRWAWEDEVRIIGEMQHGQRICTPRSVPIDVAAVVQRITVSPYASRTYLDDLRRLLAANAISVPLSTC